jgi:hypothetical protein
MSTLLWIIAIFVFILLCPVVAVILDSIEERRK